MMPTSTAIRSSFRPRLPGTVVSVLTDDTQLVQAGQVLVRLDPVDAQITLARSASALAQAVRQVRQDDVDRASNTIR